MMRMFDHLKLSQRLLTFSSFFLNSMLQCFEAGQVYGIWADRRIVVELLGCLTCLYLRVDDSCMLQAVCPPAFFFCMSLCVICPLCLSGKPLISLYAKYRQSQQGANRSYATKLHTMHASPLKAMGTLYQTQSQGRENTTYQAHSQGYGKLLPLVTQTPVSVYPTCNHKPGNA